MDDDESWHLKQVSEILKWKQNILSLLIRHDALGLLMKHTHMNRVWILTPQLFKNAWCKIISDFRSADTNSWYTKNYLAKKKVAAWNSAYEDDGTVAAAMQYYQC